MPKNWQDFALLLIDVQNDFWSGELSQQFPEFPDNIAELLQFCRSQGIEVIHLHAVFQPDQSDWMARYRLRGRIPCVLGTAGVRVPDFARPLAGERVFIKHSFDGFLQPELNAYLQQAGKRFILTAGLVTSTCVLFTTVAAAQLGFLTAVIEDCCADYPAWHIQTLDTYQFIFERAVVSELDAQHEKWTSELEKLAETPTI